MPRRNRVTPFGEIIATPARGSLMGNRGCLHDEHGRLAGRSWRTRRWIACRLSFKDRHRTIMAAGRYTELFFLDEATALAAGHRPCAECRHADYRRFTVAWAEAAPRHGGAPTAAAVDAALHAERVDAAGAKRVHAARLPALPDGVFVVLPGAPAIAWLVAGGQLWPWRPHGYGAPVRYPATDDVQLLTPPSLVRVVQAGYRPAIHDSAGTSRPA